MITSPGKKINRYYENLEKKREWDEASDRPLIDETDVVEFFKRLGFKATVYQRETPPRQEPVYSRPLVEAERQKLRHGSSGPLQRSHPERVQSGDCCSEQAAESENGRQDLQTLVKAGTGRARGSAEEGEARVSERVCDRGSAKQSRHHSGGDSERGRAGRVRLHRARQGIV